MPARRGRLLLVDDDPFVLEALTRHLRREFDVVTAEGGAAGLAALAEQGDFSVVLSDLRMPGMDGVQFLHRASEQAPDTVRLLLTGHADVEAAMAAINEGRIFRFLSKPVPPDQLFRAMRDAMKQNLLITAERVLLEETLKGSIRALVDTLALANPMAFGRATRVKHAASELAAWLELAEAWQIEMAAMLSQIGVVSLPADTVEKLFYGRTLDHAEREMVSRLPRITEQLLAHIPRLEAVRDMVAYQDRRFDGRGQGAGPQGDDLPMGARILKVVLDFDVLEASGIAPEQALETMRARAGTYDPKVLKGLGILRGLDAADDVVCELPLTSVQSGMRFLEDIRTRTGVLLIPKGFEVNAALLERIRNISPEAFHGPVKVFTKAGSPWARPAVA